MTEQKQWVSPKAILSNLSKLIYKYCYIPNSISYLIDINDTSYTENIIHCFEKKYKFCIMQRTGKVFCKGESFTIATSF